MMKRSFAKILSNTQVGPDIWKISLESPEISSSAKPGQFVFVRCSNGTDPLLRRPFSLFTIRKNTFEIVYKVVGKGTGLLTQKSKGDKLDVIGPLGTGFNLSYGTSKYPLPIVGEGGVRGINLLYGISKNPLPLRERVRVRGKGSHNFLLIAGGMGIAPLHALAEKLKGRITIAVGACSKTHLLQLDDFKKPGMNVIIATEDGSRGYHGKVTDVLSGKGTVPAGYPSKGWVGTNKASRRIGTVPISTLSNVMVFACGPYPMLKVVSAWAEKHNLPCQVSLEPHMGCGIGACLGCVVKVKTEDGIKNVRACREGPVFWSKDIIWE